MTPTEFTTNATRVHRGGSWDDYEASWVRAASRSSDVPAYRGRNIGFRCALAGRTPR